MAKSKMRMVGVTKRETVVPRDETPAMQKKLKVNTSRREIG